MSQVCGLKLKGAVRKPREGKPLVSIVTPVFNGRSYLEQTIQSVLNQSYDNIEYIIIDGGSTDGTLEIIQKYADRLDYWISQPDTGMYEAVNKGLQIAQGDILAYLNSDDLYHPDSVQITVDYFQKHPEVELIYGNCDFINSQGNFLYTYYYPGFNWNAFIALDISTIPQQTTFWRSQVHKKIGYFDTSLKMCGDFDFYAKAGRSCQIRHINRNLARFRIHDCSLTFRQGYRNKGEVETIHKRYLGSYGIYQVILKYRTSLYIKFLNISVMFKKLFFCLKDAPKER